VIIITDRHYVAAATFKLACNCKHQIPCTQMYYRIIFDN